MSEPLLSVKNLSVNFRPAAPPPVLSGIDLTLEEHQTLAIIGESGAGKSTLALAIAGLLDPNVTVEGRVMFNGDDLLALNEEEMCGIRGSGIGMIFQDAKGSLDPSMKVVEQVAEPLRFHQGLKLNEARDHAQYLLGGVNIGNDILSVAPYAHQLSGGQCQRVMIAAALACEPRLLIADEPTSSLDLILQAQIINLLKERQQATGLALMFITHDLALASKIADKVIVMNKGVVVEHGSIDSVMNKPADPYTRELVTIWADGAPGKGEGIVTA